MQSYRGFVFRHQRPEVALKRFAFDLNHTTRRTQLLRNRCLGGLSDAVFQINRKTLYGMLPFAIS